MFQTDAGAPPIRRNYKTNSVNTLSRKDLAISEGLKLVRLGCSIGRQFLMVAIGPPGNAILGASTLSMQSVSISLEWQRTFPRSQSRAQ